MKKMSIFLLLVLVACLAFAQGEESEQPEEDTGGMTFGEIIVAGGVPMVFIGLCSIMALGLLIERIMRLKPARIVPDKLVADVSGFVKQGRYGEARERCQQDPSPMANILGVALDKAAEGKDATVQAVEDAGAKEMTGFQQRVSYLSVIAVISPMIGLLGTVLGMIQAFNVIAFKAGLGKPTLLAAGISKALVTTAAGLIVAIPAMVFYHYLRVKTQTIMATIENVSENFIEMLFGGTVAQTEPAGAAVPEAAAPETPARAEQEARAKKDEEALAQRKKEESDLIERGKDAYAKGDFQGALGMFEKVLETNPENKDAQKYAEKAKAIIQQMKQGLET